MRESQLLILGIIIVILSIFFEGLFFNIGFIVGNAITVLAVLAWLSNISKRNTEKAEINPSELEINPEIDGEFHNDFSRVPAGEPDKIQPLPRSIGYGYGDGGRSVMEDLERIGIKNKKDKKD